MILRKVEEYGTCDQENLLIYANNGTALAWLNRNFREKIDFIYIDPPFNTGSRFEGYDDDLSHSEWLSMMEKRLDMSLPLLKEGRAIAIHLNQVEQPYARVLMDKIFGRERLVSQISWQRAPDRTLLGQGSAFINDCVEYILIYSKGELRKDLRPPVKEEPLSWKTLRTYSRLLCVGEERIPVDEVRDHLGNVARLYLHPRFCLEPAGAENLRQAFFGCYKEIDRIFDKMVRLSNQQKESTFQRSLISAMKDSRALYSAHYYQPKGKHRGERTRFYLRGQVILFLKDTAKLRGNKIIRVSDLNNFWSDDEIPSTGIAQEGGVNFKRGKKPERLLKRLIDTFTVEGDTVLDYFAGSGTTGAVAHKMGRHWIMVENGPRAFPLLLDRMKAVVDGRDLSGVTRETSYSGGGGFAVFTGDL